MSGLLPAAEPGPAKTVSFNFEMLMSRLTDLLFSSVVDNNPSKFAEAYWQINSLRVYTPQYSW